MKEETIKYAYLNTL